MQADEFNNEISRCLGCKIKPCEKACPLGVSPRDFINAAKNQDFNQAAKIIAAQNPLPQTCGMICPDKFCQKSCIRARMDNALQIPCLQAEIMHRGGYPELTLPPKNNKKAAVIGGGPAGLGATFELLLAGWQIDIYEKSSILGGAVRLIPEYRLPKSVFDYEISRITKNERVHIYFNHEITNFQPLNQKYDGVILALGETQIRKLNINGDKYCTPYTAYLCHPEQFKAKKVAISGGGEVALDCAITAKKNGSECVELFVRRRIEDMRIQNRDREQLKEFNIIIRDLSSVTEIKKQEATYTLCATKNCINDKGLAEAIPETTYLLSGYDMFIEALGAYYPKDAIPSDFIIAGDMTGSGGTVVQALASGRNAARQLIEENER